MKINELVAALAATTGLAAHADIQYSATPLQQPAGYDCAVEAISSTGLSAGECLGSGQQLPATWDADGNITMLATPADAMITWVTGINKSGQVSGYYSTTVFTFAALRWDNGKPVVLDTANGPMAFGINDAGDVVGGSTGATVWKHDGRVVQLPMPTLAGQQAASAIGLAINDSGAVVGSAGYFDNDGVSFVDPALWQKRMTTVLTPGLLSGFNVARALNKTGTVVGTTQDASGFTSAWMWTSSLTTPLPAIAGSAYTYASGINRAKVVVGFSIDPSSQAYRAVKWVAGQWVDLNTESPTVPGAYLEDAVAINDQGWIAARYQLSAPPWESSVVLKPLRPAADVD